MRLTYTVTIDLTTTQAAAYIREYGCDPASLATDVTSAVETTLRGSMIGTLTTVDVARQRGAMHYTWTRDGETLTGTLANYAQHLASSMSDGTQISRTVSHNGRDIPTVYTVLPQTDSRFVDFQITADGDTAFASFDSRT